MQDTTTIKRILISDPDEKSRQALAHYLREKKMEVVDTADGGAASVRVWNPDGSTAELSGNGARIAAAWAMKRTGAAEAELVVGDRVVRARRAGGGQVEVDLGPVEVGAPETIEVGAGRVELRHGGSPWLAWPRGWPPCPPGPRPPTFGSLSPPTISSWKRRRAFRRGSSCGPVT